MISAAPVVPLAVLLNEIGPSVLLTHSSTGIRGWLTATKTANVAAIVSYEPGDAVFPANEMPPPIPRVDGMMLAPGRGISMAAFLMLTKMPIQIVWGDYIPSTMDEINVGPRLSLDNRRVNVQRAKLMVEKAIAEDPQLEMARTLLEQLRAG